MRLGVHVSIAGKIYEAVDRAKALNCECMQIFSRNPRGWQATKLDKADVEEFKKRRKEADITPLVVHIPYLINLASPEDRLYEKSIQAYLEDIRRADLLSAEYFVTHLGSHKGKGRDLGIDRFARALDKIIKELKPKVKILLENTSGSGNWLGGDFEDIAEIMTKSHQKDKLGLCFDTCHAYAAGYDIKNKKGLDETLKKIDKLIGINKLKLIHINDSKGDLGSHLDRHQHIGKGKIGRDGFRLILHHPKLRDLPYVLETPKEDIKSDPMNLKTVRSIYEG